MSRSKWKGPYVDKNLINTKMSLEKEIKTDSRNSEIIPKFVGYTFRIHNGKSFINVQVNEEMIGYKFGEFVFTRKKFSYKKK